MWLLVAVLTVGLCQKKEESIQQRPVVVSQCDEINRFVSVDFTNYR